MDLQTAAARLGVHYQTAYRWVRDGSLPAVKRGTSYEISEADLESFRERRETPLPPPKQATVRNWDHHVERLYEYIVAGDELGARSVVDRLHDGGIEPATLCQQLFAPALRRIGNSWECGDVSVAEEHRASAICERLLARLAIHPRGRPRGVAVVATAVGEEHGVPATMAAVALRADRWQVHHLSTQVPTDDLIDLVRVVRAGLVVLSVAYAAAAAATEATAARVRDETTAAVLIGYPGDSVEELVERARALNEEFARTSRG